MIRHINPANTHLIAEVEEVIRRFETESHSFSKDEFTNDCFGESFPWIIAYMDSHLHRSMVLNDQETAHCDSSIAIGSLSFGWMTKAVDEHYDDVTIGKHFQVLFLAAAKKEHPRFSNEYPWFFYVDINNKERVVQAIPGNNVVFNPRKPHSMIEANNEAIYVMRTVKRAPKVLRNPYYA